MKSRMALLASLSVAVLLLSSLAVQHSDGWSGDQKGQTAADARVRKPRSLSPPGPGPYLAFDVNPKDHKSTTRYVLEITHPSGKVTTEDLKKPKLRKEPERRKRSITVPVPSLQPGKYTFVVIAESPSGASRSEPMAFEVPGGS